MSIDLTSIPAATREQQIETGRQFSSQDTLALANQMIQGLETYADALAREGFGAEDVARLVDARDGLLAAGVGRETARSDRTTTRSAHADAMKNGRAKRLRARAILENTAAVLAESADPNAQEAAREIRSTLHQTRATTQDAETLAQQIDQLALPFGVAIVKVEADKRGGAEVVPELAQSTSVLRSVAQQGAVVRGTPAETQLLDHLDGIIVGLGRRARKAAVSASKQLGDPAVAAAFSLTRLYRSTGRRKKRSPGEPS